MSSSYNPLPSIHRALLLGYLALTWFLVAIPNQLNAQIKSDFFLNNGSFEQGPYTPDLFQCADGNCDYRSTAIPGWVALRSSSSPVWYENDYAQDGSRYVSLSADAYRHGSILHIRANELNNPLSLTRSDWDLGEWYELSFWAAGGQGKSHALWIEMASIYTIISIPGTDSPLELDPSAMNWQRQSVLFQPYNQKVNLILSTHTTAFSPDNKKIYLDNFAITKVPEPGSALLLILGFGIFTRRKRP